MIQDDSDQSWENRRRHRRRYMLFKIPAYDAQTRRFLGLVQDVTEAGIQLFGVQVELGTRLTIIVQAADYTRTAPLQFDAVCRWTARENPHGYYCSGFEIIGITEEGKENLTRLIELVALG